MNNLYDILEICLQEIENGSDVEAVLSRYPEFAPELRPLLETSIQARSAAVNPSPEVLRRNKAKVLTQAAQMREVQAYPSRGRLWTVSLRRVLVSLAVLAVLFISSTNLVRAASTTLPGDNLYPVKRTWEDVIVLLTFNTQAREALEIEHENERLDELTELFAEGRSAKVDFAGIVTSQNGNQWLVSKVPVQISAQTEVRAPSVSVGDAVRIKGFTQADGSVMAERVERLPTGIPLPEVDDDALEVEQETHGNEGESNEGPGNEGSEEQAPGSDEAESPDEDSNVQEASLDGVVTSISGNVLIVNNQPVNIGNAEIRGTPRVGAAARVQGYLDASGVFIVTRIEFQDAGPGSGAGPDDGSGSGDNAADNEHDSGGSDDGSDDSGGSNSGSGGGGGDD